jgi:hypothetical protein
MRHRNTHRDGLRREELTFGRVEPARVLLHHRGYLGWGYFEVSANYTFRFQSSLRPVKHFWDICWRHTGKAHEFRLHATTEQFHKAHTGRFGSLNRSGIMILKGCFRVGFLSGMEGFWGGVGLPLIAIAWGGNGGDN